MVGWALGCFTFLRVGLGFDNVFLSLPGIVSVACCFLISMFAVSAFPGSDNGGVLTWAYDCSLFWFCDRFRCGTCVRERI